MVHSAHCLVTSELIESTIVSTTHESDSTLALSEKVLSVRGNRYWIGSFFSHLVVSRDTQTQTFFHVNGIISRYDINYAISMIKIKLNTKIWY